MCFMADIRIPLMWPQEAHHKPKTGDKLELNIANRFILALNKCKIFKALKFSTV